MAKRLSANQKKIKEAVLSVTRLRDTLNPANIDDLSTMLELTTVLSFLEKSEESTALKLAEQILIIDKSYQEE